MLLEFDMKATKFVKKQLLLLIIIFFSSVTFASDDLPSTSNNVKDPYEKFNRVMFKMNDVMDTVLFRPVATLYIKIVPKPLSKGFSNFFNNLDTISTVLNDILQANFYQATSDFWRLFINSTIGLLGFLDIATDIGLEQNKEDFGLTMAQWGYKDSNYLVLPFLGPGTIRDQIGWMLNYQYFSAYPYIYPISTRYQLYAGSVVVRRAELLHYQGLFDQAALDKYTFMRDAFLQRRNYLIERNKQLNNPYLEKNTEQEALVAEDQTLVVS